MMYKFALEQTQVKYKGMSQKLVTFSPSPLIGFEKTLTG